MLPFDPLRYAIVYLQLYLNTRTTKMIIVFKDDKIIKKKR